jgi:hypothetical protein
VREAWTHEAPANPVLRYLAIVRAARDFGVDGRELDRLIRRFDARDARPQELADALAGMLLAPRTTS